MFCILQDRHGDGLLEWGGIVTNRLIGYLVVIMATDVVFYM